MASDLLGMQMTALMGPSGSGKTSLLDVLSGRKSTGRITGSVLYDGQQRSKGFIRASTGYVEQTPTLLPSFTAKEMLTYTAQVRGGHMCSVACITRTVTRTLHWMLF